MLLWLRQRVRALVSVCRSEAMSAMIEKQIEEDERMAEDAVQKSESQETEEGAGPGYMMIALQEQLSQLQAQIELIQHFV